MADKLPCSTNHRLVESLTSPLERTGKILITIGNYLKYILPILLTMSIIILGCTSSHVVNSSLNNTSNWIVHFNEISKDHQVTIVFRDTIIYGVQNVQAKIDFIAYDDSTGKKRIIVSIDSIKKVIIANPTYGLFEGIGFGLFVGAYLGYVNAALQYPHPLDMEGLAYVVYPVIYGVGGSIIGGIIGHNAEHKSEIIFNHK